MLQFTILFDFLKKNLDYNCLASEKKCFMVDFILNSLSFYHAWVLT
jgi:hypothetical protein